MKLVISRAILWLWLVRIFILSISAAYGEKYTIEKYDRYLNSHAGFFDTTGNKVYLEHYEGTNILLVFWATWCGTCVSDLSSLDNLQKDFRKLPFKIIVMSEDNRDISIIKNYFTKQDIRHLEVFQDDKNKLFKELSIINLPTALFINSDGKNKLVFRGRIKWYDNEIRRTILSEIGDDLELPNNTHKAVDLNRNVIVPELQDTTANGNKEPVKLHNEEGKANKT